MPNDIFKKILDLSVNQFVEEFCKLPQEIFYDEHNKLFHPGEYGRLRESIIKKLFKTILYEDLSISEGFLINNNNNEKSTQCDIIIYDYKKTPILKDLNNIFIPVETAAGIGEVKSTLSKKEFATALRKLALNKALKDYASGTIIKRSKNFGDFNPKTEDCDQLFSFLICKKLDFNIENIDFEDIYKGIERRNRHNVILSIEDGLFNYFFSFDFMDEARRFFYKSKNVDVSMSSVMSGPRFLNVDCIHNYITYSEDRSHIKEFISNLSHGIQDVTILNVDIRTYYRSFIRNSHLF